MGGVHLPVVSTCFLYAMVFPYIFLLFDCFEWVLIDCIEKWRVHSELWQFQMGEGDHHQFSLYLPISWLFQMSSHWLHSKVKSLLWALAVSNGGIIVSFTQVNLTIWVHFALASQADLPGRAENLRNVNCSCRGSVVLGGVYHKIYLVSYWHCLISSY